MQRYPTCRGFEGYLALIIAIKWYREITPEQSFRIMSGKHNMKLPCRKITPEMVKEMHRILLSKNFKSYDKLERRFKVDRYTMIGLVNQYRQQFKAMIRNEENEGDKL